MSQLTLILVIVGLISVYMLLQSSGKSTVRKTEKVRSAELTEMEAKLARMARRLEDLETILAEETARK